MQVQPLVHLTSWDLVGLLVSRMRRLEESCGPTGAHADGTGGDDAPSLDVNEFAATHACLENILDMCSAREMVLPLSQHLGDATGTRTWSALLQCATQLLSRQQRAPHDHWQAVQSFVHAALRLVRRGEHGAGAVATAAWHGTASLCATCWEQTSSGAADHTEGNESGPGDHELKDPKVAHLLRGTLLEVLGSMVREAPASLWDLTPEDEERLRDSRLRCSDFGWQQPSAPPGTIALCCVAMLRAVRVDFMELLCPSKGPVAARARRSSGTLGRKRPYGEAYLSDGPASASDSEASSLEDELVAVTSEMAPYCPPWGAAAYLFVVLCRLNAGHLAPVVLEPRFLMRHGLPHATRLLQHTDPEVRVLCLPNAVGGAKRMAVRLVLPRASACRARSKLSHVPLPSGASSWHSARCCGHTQCPARFPSHGRACLFSGRGGRRTSQVMAGSDVTSTSGAAAMLCDSLTWPGAGTGLRCLCRRLSSSTWSDVRTQSADKRCALALAATHPWPPAVWK